MKHLILSSCGILAALLLLRQARREELIDWPMARNKQRNCFLETETARNSRWGQVEKFTLRKEKKQQQKKRRNSKCFWVEKDSPEREVAAASWERPLICWQIKLSSHWLLQIHTHINTHTRTHRVKYTCNMFAIYILLGRLWLIKRFNLHNNAVKVLRIDMVQLLAGLLGSAWG